MRMTSFVDRFKDNYFIFQSLIFIIVAVVGFYPSSSDILSGNRENPHISVHLHAFVMVSWLALLLLQASLKKASCMQLHMKLGWASAVLAFLMVTSLIYVSFYGLISGVGTEFIRIKVNIFFMQVYSVILFCMFYIWAYRARKRDPDTHKRVMLVCTLILMHAAIGRMPWLPFYNIPESVNSIHAYNLALIIPGLIYDKLTIGKIHKAFVLSLSIFIIFIFVTSFAWSSQWWFSIVNRAIPL